MRRRAATSSGPTWTKYDARQHAVQVPHGTSASPSPAATAAVARSQGPKAPASSSSLTGSRTGGRYPSPAGARVGAGRVTASAYRPGVTTHPADRPRASVFIATSVDGFIARPDD